jgi:hypothetical protein
MLYTYDCCGGFLIVSPPGWLTGVLNPGYLIHGKSYRSGLMRHVDTFAGANVWLRCGDDVHIVLEWRGEADQAAIRGLGEALGGFYRMGYEDGICRAEICYTEDLDVRLRHLIDVLIALRYAHPRMVQLPLALDEEDAKELAEAMHG